MSSEKEHKPADASKSITQLDDLDKLKAYMFIRDTGLNTPVMREKIIASAQKKANAQAFSELFAKDPKVNKNLINGITGITTKTVTKAFDTILSHSPERHNPKWQASGIINPKLTYKSLYINQLIKDPASAIISSLAEKTLEVQALKNANISNNVASDKTADREKKLTTIINNLSGNIQNIYGASLNDVKKMSGKVFDNKEQMMQSQLNQVKDKPKKVVQQR